MYHIPNDKRARRSAEALCAGLLDCLEHKSYTDVTVRDLSMASGVSRATFYRLFDNVSDIFLWKCDSIMTTALDRVRRNEGTDITSALEGFVAAGIENRTLLEALIRCDRTQILYEVHAKHTQEIRDIFLSGSEINELQAEYLTSLLASIIPAAFRVWVQHPEAPDILVGRLRSSLALLNEIFLETR